MKADGSRWPVAVCVLAVALGVGAAALLFRYLPIRVRLVRVSTMQPTLAPGDVVFVKKAAEYHEGQIVSYARLDANGGKPSGPGLNVARIVKLDSNTATVTVQGDSAGEPEWPLRTAKLEGRVVGSVPGLGRRLSGLSSPLVATVFVTIPISIVVTHEYMRLLKLHFRTQRYRIAR